MIAWLPLLVSLTFAQPQSPIQATYGYSRATTSGIPEGRGVAASPNRPISTSYFIYVVVRKGVEPSVRGVWLNDAFHEATLQKVPAPVTVDQNPVVPTGKKETLVPATSSDVYQVCPTGERRWTAANDTERRLTRENEVVVFIESNGATWYAPVKALKRLPPVPGR